MLREERRDDLLVGDLGLLDRVRGDVLQLARAHVEERELDEIALAVEAEDVAVDVVDRDDALLFAHLLDRAQLVPVDRGELEAHLARGLLHLHVELARQLVVTALEELRDGVDLLGVPAAVDLEDARGRAALDLVLQARPLAARELDVAARAELEVLVDEVQRAPRGGRRVVGPEVAGAVGRGAADDLEARPHAFGHAAEAERDEVLVVAELDVVAGPVLLDEVVLEDRRFLLVGRDDRVEVADGRLEDRDERALVAPARPGSSSGRASAGSWPCRRRRPCPSCP